jgi:hypothetical protein
MVAGPVGADDAGSVGLGGVPSAALRKAPGMSGGTAIHPAFVPDGKQVLFVLTDAASGAFDAMATIGLDGSGLAPATSSGFMPGTHPRPRPTP